MTDGFLDRIRRWVGWPAAKPPSFGELLEAACDETMTKVSARALMRSLAASDELASDVRRSTNTNEIQAQFSTMETR